MNVSEKIGKYYISYEKYDSKKLKNYLLCKTDRNNNRYIKVRCFIRNEDDLNDYLKGVRTRFTCKDCFEYEGCKLAEEIKFR